MWRCQIEPKSDLYGDKTGKLFDPEKVFKGRLTELKNMNDHHVYDWIDEAEIPKGILVGSTTSNHVKGMYLAPHIHEHFTIHKMVTANCVHLNAQFEHA